MRPEKGTYPAYFDHYIQLVKEDKVVGALHANSLLFKRVVAKVPSEKQNFSYAEGKWTVKQLLIHIIDTERILAYRALRFARKDPQQPLPFDENIYAANAEVAERSLADLLSEFESVRNATVSLYQSFSVPILLNKGQTAIGVSTVIAIGFMICGHSTHHLNILQERYL